MLYLLEKDNKTKEPNLQPIALSSLMEAGWREKDLENILSKNLSLVLRENQLMVIAQERQWQEEADILAMDESGTLYIFEIKRTQSDDSNLLQVIRYGQIFGQYAYLDLEAMFRKLPANHDASLAEAHKNHFELAEPLPPRDFNKKQQFVVVTAGVDLKTVEAVAYWREKGLPIATLTYHVYRHGNSHLVEFHSYSPQPEDYIGLLSHDYVINTCLTYIPTAYKNMLAENKVAAYGGRAAAVDGIQKHDRVFLYHNRVGVIAVGKAKDRVHCVDSDDPDAVEHFVPVDWVLKADPYEQQDKCVSPGEINRATGGNRKFRLTVFGIPKQDADAIEKLLRQKHCK